MKADVEAVREGGLFEQLMKFSGPDPSDNELVQKVREGDEKAFTDLYRRHQGSVYRYAMQMSGTPETAEEVAQEVFMTLIQGNFKFDAARGSLVGYLIGIARNQLFRRNEHNVVMIPFEDNEHGVASSPPDALISPADPLAELAATQALEALRKGLLGLPGHYREVVVLCDLEEMTYAQAAAVLGCAVGTIRSRLHRAHALLLERLRRAEDPPAMPSKMKPSRCFA